MTRRDMINEMADELKLERKTCTNVLNAFIEGIVHALETGGKYTQPGFGTFKTAETKERVGRNPATKQKMLYPKKLKIRFKASDILKDELNGR